MKEVIILGMGLSSIECPYDCEVWGCFGNIFRNEAYYNGNMDTLRLKRLDKVITMHSEAIEGSGENVNLLRVFQDKYGCEIITSQPWPSIETTVYPIEEVLGNFGTAYFADSICYMIALAIHRGYEHLKIYGVDGRAYTYAVTERAPAGFWCGVARGRGVRLTVANMSPLFNKEIEVNIPAYTEPTRQRVGVR